MTTCMVALREHQSLRLASALGFARGEDHLPVVDKSGVFLGLVHHRDVVAAERSASILRLDDQADDTAVPISSLILSPVHTISIHSSVEYALELLLSSRLGILPVIDDEDSFRGLVTIDSMLGLCEEWAEGGAENVAKIMTRALVTATVDTTLVQAIDLMHKAEIRHLPVINEEGTLKTVVSLRDLVAYQRLAVLDEESESTGPRLEEFMGTEVWTTTTDSSTLDVVRTLRDNRFGCLPIVEDGHLLGIVTETDLLRALLNGNRKSIPAPESQMSLRRYMSSASPSVSPDDRVERALRIFVESNPSTLLVIDMDKGEAVGVVSQGDLMHSLHVPRFSGVDDARAEFLERPISEIMTRGVITIHADKDVSEAAEFLAQQKIHSLIVLDRDGRIGTFGPHEVFRAAGDIRTPALLRDIMTNVIFEIDCKETLRSGLRFLDSAGVRGLVVRDGDHPVGIFGLHEALAAAKTPLETPVEMLMSSRILCLPGDMPCFRAAQQAGALGVEQIVVTSQNDSNGLVSASDLLHLLVRRLETKESEDTLQDRPS